MCLDTIQVQGKNLEKGYDLPKVGYKVFLKYKEYYKTPIQGSETLIQPFKWSGEKNLISYFQEDYIMPVSGIYDTGFHIFSNPDDAFDFMGLSDLTVCEVKFKEVNTIGINDLNDKGFTMVANKIKIIAEVSKVI